jgi:predicted phage terminase large subunit-like protein
VEQERVSLTKLTDRYAFLDPASGKQGREKLRGGLAQSAIVVVAQDQLSRVFVLEAWAKRCPTPELVGEMLRVQKEWRPRAFGVEANAMQSLFVDTVRMIAQERGERLPLQAVYQNTKVDKFFRIRTALQPLLGEGRLILGEDQIELKNEIKAFPRGQRVDIVDALASAVKMLPEVPQEEEIERQASGLAKYLRQQGVPPAYIEQRMDRFFGDQGVTRKIIETAEKRRGRAMNIDRI